MGAVVEARHEGDAGNPMEEDAEVEPAPAAEQSNRNKDIPYIFTFTPLSPHIHDKINALGVHIHHTMKTTIVQHLVTEAKGYKCGLDPSPEEIRRIAAGLIHKYENLADVNLDPVVNLQNGDPTVSVNRMWLITDYRKYVMRYVAIRIFFAVYVENKAVYRLQIRTEEPD